MSNPKKRSKKRIRIRPIRIVGLVVLFAAGASLLFFWNLSHEIEERFSGRRWSIPSRVFSDTTMLYPGQSFPRQRLEAKLHRLGYRKVERAPERKGEIRTTDSHTEVFLRDLVTPQQTHSGIPLRISYRKGAIDSITRLDNREPVPLLEIEPEELMLFFGKEREERRLVSLKEIPKHLIHAVLAAEDARFFQHPGLDPIGIVRALVSNLRHGSLRQGGSTITQQLAKNYFLTPERTYSRKFKELLISLVMESKYSKEEILEIYLNEIYMGNRGSVSINGIGEASFFYFGKPVNDLSIAEAATLAGLIRAPNHYSPFADRKRSLQRRNLVIENMLSHGWISKEEFDISTTQAVATAEYEVYAKQAPYFMDYLSHQLHTLYSPDALSSMGLSIYTSLDPEVQRAAEEALMKGLSRLEKANPSLLRKEPEKRLQGAVVVLQPRTGYILAMVGGRKYGESQFNRITQARRQPGSAFKPFVFLAAMDEYTPATILSNEDNVYNIEGREWRPENYSPIPETRIPMRTALAKSVNRATADLTMKIGVDRVITAASAFGFSTQFPPYPSISLGSAEIIPLELARAYCAFAADGLLPHPISMKEVANEKGEILERRHLTIGSATSPEKAFLITSMLRSVVEAGTARSLVDKGIHFPVAGKTGTTNDFKDAWFVGYTPDILALVWVGFDDGTPIKASGSSAALPIFADLMKSIPQHSSGVWFDPPPGVVTRTICPMSAQLAVDGRCPAAVQEVFLAANAPDEPCGLHSEFGRDVREPFREIFRDVKKFFGIR
ncbi:MAG: PBP1A family penicillin-binding protein [Desulfobacteraceae bacterium]|nr:MAG: PBP1A family penicillin-binding protein [Desulfobacteraceae bacterium]